MNDAPNIIIPQTIIAGATRRHQRLAEEIQAAGHWLVKVFRATRAGKSELHEIDYIKNLVTNVGLDLYLTRLWKTGVVTPAWYLGLTDGTPTVAAGDTMSSHAGWTEVVAYDEAVRQTWTGGSVSSQSVDNSASAAQFTISTNSTTVGGAFAVDDSTKSGTTGNLATAGAFSAGDKSLDDNDTIDVTATFTTAAA